MGKHVKRSYKEKKIIVEEHLKGASYVQESKKHGVRTGTIANWFSQLKEEHLRQIGLKKRKKQETRKEIKKYIAWYNTRRIQKDLGYLSPEQYKQKLLFI